jgi:hypothetical protein
MTSYRVYIVQAQPYRGYSRLSMSNMDYVSYTYYYLYTATRLSPEQSDIVNYLS